MTLAEGQVQVGDLVMGPGTPYRLLGSVNPWSRSVRADQGGKRAWGHGSWSGAEWQDEAVVPIPVQVQGTTQDVAGWTAAHQILAAAFAPSHVDVELRWCLGGVEHAVFGRPRMVDPDVKTIGLGYAITQCAFAATDPLIYSGVEHSVQLGLPQTTGGLTVPMACPITVVATVASGRAAVTNAGTAPVGMRWRIGGPVSDPRVAVVSSSGTSTTRFWLDLDAGQWLDVDTAARTVLMNGVVSRRGQASGDWPMLPPGAAEVAFASAAYDVSALLTVSWRDAWY